LRHSLFTKYLPTDHYKEGDILAEHLYKMGYRNLGIVFNKKSDLSLEERKKGFLEYANEKNLVVKKYHLKSEYYISLEKIIKYSEILGEKILKSKNKPDAIFTSNDEMAVGIIKSAIKLGIKIPDELGIVGFDNSLSSILSPIPITTIRQKKENVAKEAFEAIMRKLQNSEIKIERFIEPELIKWIQQTSGRKIYIGEIPGPV